MVKPIRTMTSKTSGTNQLGQTMRQHGREILILYAIPLAHGMTQG